ncbi:AMP-binding protein [Leifsonia sp. YIM 134122]|uniref:AMP-binding protein n=1 Tax=Leifsonia stereocauli TaxID=3134136 RepID=A0ABU9W5A1_9MICO
MTGPLALVDGGNADAVLQRLRGALDGSGPAVFPIAPADDALVAADLGQAPFVPDEVALVVQTSGSTGRPKRVALSADALLASAAASAAAIGGSGQWLLALPAHYIAGANVLVRSIAAGTTPVMLDASHFDAGAFADAASRLTADLRFTSLVPAQLARIVDAAEHDKDVLAAARRFTRILLGGQAAPAALLDRAAALGLAVTRTYGSSETAGGCVYDGVPIGSTRVAVRDGLVELAGPTLARGYLDDDERTAAAFVERDGCRWYRTGDLGELVAGGVDAGAGEAETPRLRVLGRADNVIISGGVKVSLDAVERAVRALSGLEDAVVVGIPHPRWGEVPAVAVPTAAGRGSVHPPLDDIRAVVGRTLGVAARPAVLVELGEVPLLSSGKPDRRAIVELMATQNAG